MSEKKRSFNTLKEAQDFVSNHNFKNCTIKEKKGKYFLIQKSKAIFGNYVYTNSAKKGVIMYKKEMNFEDMIGWVYRNCPGCEKIEILPNKVIPEVIAYYLDRIEIYTIEDYDASENQVL